MHSKCDVRKTSKQSTDKESNNREGLKKLQKETVNAQSVIKRRQLQCFGRILKGPKYSLLQLVIQVKMKKRKMIPEARRCPSCSTMDWTWCKRIISTSRPVQDNLSWQPPKWGQRLKSDTI